MKNKENVIKNKIWIIITSILSVVILALSITIICITVIPKKIIDWGETKGDEITTSFYQQESYNDGIYNDAVKKANNNSASIYFFSRRGAYIATQMIADIALQKSINPNKKIYMSFSSSTTPDPNQSSDPNQWPLALDWDALDINGSHFKDMGSSSFQIKEKDLDKIYKEFRFDKNQKIDLYMDSYSFQTSSKDLMNNFVSDIGNYWDNINSLTFFADGIAIYSMEEQYKNLLNSYNTQDINFANTTLSLLKNDLISTKEVKDNNLKTMSKLLPILSPNGNDDFIQMFSPTHLVYEDEVRENVFMSSGPNFKKVIENIKDVNILKQVVGLDDYEQTNNFKDQEGKTNYVFSGNLVQNETGAQNDANSIIEIYNNFLAAHALDSVNVLYKPHPRSSDDYLNRMVQIVSNETGTNASEWIQIIPKSIPFEFFAMTGEFNDVLETSTDYQLFLTATSTVVPALYECGVTSENVEYYILNSEKDLSTIQNWYGDTGIIDYDKVININ